MLWFQPENYTIFNCHLEFLFGFFFVTIFILLVYPYVLFSFARSIMLCVHAVGAEICAIVWAPWVLARLCRALRVLQVVMATVVVFVLVGIGVSLLGLVFVVKCPF